MSGTSGNISISCFEDRLEKIDKRIRRLDNVKLRHVIALESEFEDVKNLLKRLNDRFEEIQSIVNKVNAGKQVKERSIGNHVVNDY